jgi:molybdopterin converting factor small subunit
METEIEVRFYGGVAVAAGVERARVVFEGSTLGELLSEIKRRWPGAGDFIDGPRSGSAVLVLNGTALEAPDPSTKLKPGDALSIMPFVAGG